MAVGEQLNAQVAMMDDRKTADAFANSWNHLPPGSIYTYEQFAEWLAPATAKDIQGQSVLELGCGNASLLVYVVQWQPAQVTGVDLGSSLVAAEANMRATGFERYSLVQADLMSFSSDGFNFVYCIGVIHHLAEPRKGFDAVLANTKRGGRFHCWVYAREGNRLVMGLVDPIRKLTSKFPWWLTKYVVAPPLAIPFFAYARVLRTFQGLSWIRKAPFFEYSMWISKREFSFFRHVVFDQLLAPRTCYIDRATIESWLRDSRVVTGTAYILFRNGNSWKFGGTVQ